MLELLTFITAIWKLQTASSGNIKLLQVHHENSKLPRSQFTVLLSHKPPWLLWNVLSVVHILSKLAHRLELMQAVMILLAIAMFPWASHTYKHSLGLCSQAQLCSHIIWGRLIAKSSMNYSNKYKVLYVLCFYLWKCQLSKLLCKVLFTLFLWFADTIKTKCMWAYML